MNASVSPILVKFAPIKTAGARRYCVPVQASIVPVSDTAVIVMFDLPASDIGRRKPRPLSGSIGGAVLPKPLISSPLPLRTGAMRYLVLLRTGGNDLAQNHVTFNFGAETVAFINPDWLQSPLRDLADAVDGLTPQGQQRLLKLFLTSAASLLGREQGPAFVRTIKMLLDMFQVQDGVLASRCPIGQTGEVLTYRFSDRDLAEAPKELISLKTDRVARVSDPLFLLETGGLLHVLVPGSGLGLQQFVALGDRPLLLKAEHRLIEAQPFAQWLQRRPQETRSWGNLVLETAARHDPVARALIQELKQLPDAQPQIRLHDFSATSGGLLVWLDVKNQGGQVTGLRVERGSISIDLDLPTSGQIRVWVAMPHSDGPARLRLIFRSGLLRIVHEGMPTSFYGVLPAGIPTESVSDAAQTLAAAWLDRALQPMTHCIETFARSQVPKHLTLIAPPSQNPDLIRARAALIACEAAAGKVEVIYTCAADHAEPIVRLLIDIAASYGVTHSLICTPLQTNAADRLLLALGAAQAEAVLLLGEDVLPEAPGWLAPWMAALGRKSSTSVLGGALLTACGSVAHAGGWLKQSTAGQPVERVLRLKGMPLVDLGTAASVNTQVVTADCVGLKPLSVSALIKAGATVPDPDTLLQKMMVSLGAARPARTQLRHRFVRYSPEPIVDPVTLAAANFSLGAVIHRHPSERSR